MPPWVRSRIKIAITCLMKVYIQSLSIVEGSREARHNLKVIVYLCLHRAYMHPDVVLWRTFEHVL